MRMFFSFFENVTMRKKEEKDQAIALISVLDGHKLEYFYISFKKDVNYKLWNPCL